MHLQPPIVEYYIEDRYVGKQLVPWKKYQVNNWLQELHDRMDRYTDIRYLTVIKLTALYKGAMLWQNGIPVMQ